MSLFESWVSGLSGGAVGISITTLCQETCCVLMVFELRSAAYGGTLSNDEAKGTGFSGRDMDD